MEYLYTSQLLFDSRTSFSECYLPSSLMFTITSFFQFCNMKKGIYLYNDPTHNEVEQIEIYHVCLYFNLEGVN